MDVHLDKLPEVIARYLIARELVVWTRQPVVVDVVAGELTLSILTLSLIHI